jgi:translocation and assembly module TamA
MINARMVQDQKTLADVLSSQGFFDASVHGSIAMPDAGKDGDIKVTLDVAPGPRYVLGTITFDGADTVPDDLVAKAFVPKSGEPIVADRILSAEANIGVTLPQSGYPFVKVGQRDILLDAATRKGDYTLPVTPGPRSRFGEIVVQGKSACFSPNISPPSPASRRAIFTTAARWTTCARLWSPPTSIPWSRSSRRKAMSQWATAPNMRPCW